MKFTLAGSNNAVRPMTIHVPSDDSPSSIPDVPMILAIVFFILAFEWFLLRAVPGVYFGDCGEILAAVFTGGIPHPTGFPAYLLLATPLAQWGKTPFWVNVLSSMFAALSTVLLFRITLKSLHSRFAGLVSVLVMLFSTTFLLHASCARVYTLNLALFLGFILIAIDGRSNKRRALFLGFLAGLGLGTHLVFLAGWVFAVLFHWKRLREWARLAPWFAMGFLLSSSLYLWLPLRAVLDPPFNWGQPSDWGSFLGHLTQRGYKAKMFARDVTGSLDYLKALFHDFSREWSWVCWALAGIGGWVLYAKRRVLFFAGLSVWVFVVFLIGFYGDETDLFVAYRYFLPVYAMAALAAGAGAKVVSEACPVPLRKTAAYLLLAVVALTAFFHLRPWRNLPRTLIAHDFAADVMRSMDRGTFLLLEGWGDKQVYPLVYGRYVFGWRPDLRFADPTGLLFKDATRVLKENPPMKWEDLVKDWFLASGGSMYVPVERPATPTAVCRTSGIVFRIADTVRREGKAAPIAPAFIFRERSAEPFPPDGEGVEIGAYAPLAGARIAWERRQRDRALRHLQDARRKGASSADISMHAGVLYFDMEEDRMAEEAFLRVVQLQPCNIDARLNLGILYGKTGRYPESLGKFDEVLKMEHGHPMAIHYRDVVRRLMDRR